MSIFDLSRSLIDEYSKYVESFLSIADERIQKLIHWEILKQDIVWPDPLLQLNTVYQTGATVKELAEDRKVHPLCERIFRSPTGQAVHLYCHQQDAIEKGLNRNHFVVTSGTSSGKRLACFVPVLGAVLRDNSREAKVRAIVVYPMNALVNSQHEELTQLAKTCKGATGDRLPGQDKNSGTSRASRIEQ